MKSLTAAVLSAAALGAVTLTAMPSAEAASACGKGGARLEAVALTKGGQLLCLDVRNPGNARSLGKVDNLDSGTKLVGIDFRPENGKLYGLGSNGAIYTVDAKTADATKVAAGLKNASGGDAVALSGTSFGIDFNPAVDRLRVISDTGQNLRINVADGVTNVDTGLTNPPTPPATPPGPGASGVTGAAYTNNDKLVKTTTGTTLFDVDSAADRVSIQSPANGGTLAPTGGLGRDVDADNGFDIYSKVRNGVAQQNVAYAALSNGARSTLYKVDLLDGSLRSLGQFNKNRGEIIGLTLPLNQG